MVFGNLYCGSSPISSTWFWLQALTLRAQAGNTEPGGGEMVLLGTSFMTFGVLIAALFLSTFVLVINRFRKMFMADKVISL